MYQNAGRVIGRSVVGNSTCVESLYIPSYSQSVCVLCSLWIIQHSPISFSDSTCVESLYIPSHCQSVCVLCSLWVIQHSLINPRRACAARVTVVVLCVCVCVCVCVFVCPGRSSATHATKRQTRHTHGLSILLAPE